MAQQTAVEFLAEKYNFLIWLRNRDEISAAKADELRKQFYEQAKEMEKEQLLHFAKLYDDDLSEGKYRSREELYNETYEKNTFNPVQEGTEGDEDNF